MERNIDRKTLSFSKGMTNIPSDLLSDDTELVESDGFIYRDGEMKPVQKPTTIGNIPYKIMYVHKGADYENIVAYDDDGNIYCYPKGSDGTYDTLKAQNFSVGKLYDIKSVGNTLICATENGLHYLLFKGEKYIDLGTELPKPDVKFKFVRNQLLDYLEEGRTPIYPLYYYSVSSKDNGWTCYDNTTHDYVGELSGHTGYTNYEVTQTLTIKDEHADDFQTMVQGHVAQCISYIKGENKFAFPFFARYALRLFDGSYALISNPIICYPSVAKNFRMEYCEYSKDDKKWHVYYNKRQKDEGGHFMCRIRYSDLEFSCNIPNRELWLDIIKDIVVFITDDVCPFEIDGKYDFVPEKDVHKSVSHNYIDDNGYNEDVILFNWNTLQARVMIGPVYKTEAKIIEDLLTKTQFYKLFSVKCNNDNLLDGTYHNVTAYDKTKSDVMVVAKGTLTSLTEQEQLKVDDYYGWTSLVSKKMFPYNKRINLFDIIRKPFDGFNVFRANTIENAYQPKWVRHYVHIVSSSMDTWVCSEKLKTSNDKIYNDWYYYPDPNATEMVIECGTDENHGQTVPYYRIPLQEHPRLNGAYSFAQLPPSTIERTTKPEMAFGGVEQIDSQIFTSVVNNPFVFEASGDNTIGTGKILEIAANTEPVSQGQFGQYPLLVFTSEGIYGMSVNSEGLYSASYPISREVCNDDSPMVPTDKLIFFVSKKGLMATSGGTVANMSELMRGRNPRNFADIQKESFLNFLNGCIIAYDYRDSLLRIYKNGYTYHYIYNMIDKTFGLVNDGIDVKAVVNNYPDNIVQDKDGNIYTLIGKPEINDDENTYSGSFVSRPLKLGGSINLKSIRAVKNLLDTNDGKITLEIWGSNDCKHWQKLVSLGGKPWKYFTLRYALSDFKAADSFAGSIVEFQTRRDDKMR